MEVTIEWVGVSRFADAREEWAVFCDGFVMDYFPSYISAKKWVDSEGLIIKGSSSKEGKNEKVI